MRNIITCDTRGEKIKGKKQQHVEPKCNTVDLLCFISFILFFPLIDLMSACRTEDLHGKVKRASAYLFMYLFLHFFLYLPISQLCVAFKSNCEQHDNCVSASKSGKAKNVYGADPYSCFKCYVPLNIFKSCVLFFPHWNIIEAHSTECSGCWMLHIVWWYFNVAVGHLCRLEEAACLSCCL